jgi:hypothetical protein
MKGSLRTGVRIRIRRTVYRYTLQATAPRIRRILCIRRSKCSRQRRLSSPRRCTCLMLHIIFHYRLQEKRCRLIYSPGRPSARCFRRMTLCCNCCSLCLRIACRCIPQKTWYSCIRFQNTQETMLLRCMNVSRCGIPPGRIMLHRVCYCTASGRIRHVRRNHSSSSRSFRCMSICLRRQRSSSPARRIASHCILQGT